MTAATPTPEPNATEENITMADDPTTETLDKADTPPSTDSATPESAARGARAYITLATREVAGMGGFTGPPDVQGLVMMGYSVFPAFQRQGYASEAARALADWALTQPGVASIQATISPRNIASERVAAYAGLHRTDATEDDPDEGLVVVWQRTQDPA